MPKLTDQQVIEKLQQFTWEPWLERHFSPFLLSFYNDGTQKKSFEKIGLPGVWADAFVYENHMWYTDDVILAHLARRLRKYLKKNSIFDITASLDRFTQRSERRLLKLIQEDIDPLKKLKIAKEIFVSGTSYIWLAHGLEYLYNEDLQKIVPKYIKEDIDIFIGDAGYPSKKNAHTLMEEAIERGESSKEIAKKFGWIKVRDGFGKPFTISEIEKQRKEQKQKEKRKEVIIPKPLQKIFAEFRELVFYRTERTDVFYKLLVVARPIFKQVAKKYKLSFQDLKKYTIQDLLNGTLKKYPDSFGCATYKDQGIFFTQKIFGNQAVQKNETLTGAIAQKGCVRGVVKIVKSTQDLSKVQEGDIFVTQMTFPSFIAGMHRAAAFVTDEGGITCHAAIVAREMKKPCIIGTKIATKVLKDGMMVEVDAHNCPKSLPTPF